MKFAIITSGGDAPGMNACIRAAVRYALSQGMEVCGFHRGYQGILEDDYTELDRLCVSNIIQCGGTFLQTDRCAAFREEPARVRAAEILRAHGAEALLVIGGDGSFRGARDLHEDTGIRVVGIPGTIDNDIGYTEYTIGFDTAVNNVLWAINALRDTMQSHNKVTFVEVMGRRCGDIALHAAVTGGAEYVLIPEVPFDLRKIAQEIAENARYGKKSNLIVVAEGAGKMEDLCREFEEISGICPRQTRLGFIQRGGSPTHLDRLLAEQFAMAAVDRLMQGGESEVIGIRSGRVIHEEIGLALSRSKQPALSLYRAISNLS